MKRYLDDATEIIRDTTEHNWKEVANEIRRCTDETITLFRLSRQNDKVSQLMQQIQEL